MKKRDGSGRWWVVLLALSVFYMFIFNIWMFSKMVGRSPQQTHGVFLLKMIILGCDMGVPPFKETPMGSVVLMFCC